MYRELQALSRHLAACSIITAALFFEGEHEGCIVSYTHGRFFVKLARALLKLLLPGQAACS